MQRNLKCSELAQIAEGSGLQWVNSNPERIAQAQAAMAAEAKPARVPRERPPAIVVDAGPLVLVETRLDLQGMKLPFEKAALTEPCCVAYNAASPVTGSAGAGSSATALQKRLEERKDLALELTGSMLALDV